jgi:hypothetical protein
MRTPYLMLQKTLAAAISLLVLLSSCGNNATTAKNTAADSSGMKSEKDPSDKMKI